MQTVWSQVNLQSDVKNPFVNEIIEIKATVPGDDTQAPVKLFVNHLNFKIIDDKLTETFSFNNITGESESSISYKIYIVFSEPGETTITCKVDNSISEDIIINVKPLDFNNKEFPFLHTKISDHEIYKGEKGYIANYLFSNEYITKTYYTRPFIDMNVNQLEAYKTRKIYMGDIEARYEVVSAFSFDSDKSGSYVIPESGISYNDKNFLIPSYNITVKDLPSDVVVNSVIGKSLKWDIQGLKDEYKNGEDVLFFIEIFGNANLSDINSLRSYFNIPEFLLEEVVFSREDYRDGEMFHVTKFQYSGRLNTFFGFRFKGLNIPFFNTESKEFSYIISPNYNISGDIPAILLYVVILIILIITIGLILFTINFLKNKSKITTKKSNNHAESFNLSKRENEIFIILVNGKSTKEIADELYISPETVKKHIQNILKKTNTNSRLELLALMNSIK